MTYKYVLVYDIMTVRYIIHAYVHKIICHESHDDCDLMLILPILYKIHLLIILKNDLLYFSLSLFLNDFLVGRIAITSC